MTWRLWSPIYELLKVLVFKTTALPTYCYPSNSSVGYILHPSQDIDSSLPVAGMATMCICGCSKCTKQYQLYRSNPSDSISFPTCRKVLAKKLESASSNHVNQHSSLISNAVFCWLRVLIHDPSRHNTEFSQIVCASQKNAISLRTSTRVTKHNTQLDTNLRRRREVKREVAKTKNPENHSIQYESTARYQVEA